MPTPLRRALALTVLLGAANACELGTGSDGRFTVMVLSFGGGLAQPYYTGDDMTTPRRPIVLTGDTARFQPYAARCSGVRVAGKVDENTVDCVIVPTPSGIRWSSSNPAVAEVDPSSGLARATGSGTVTIRAEADGYVTDHTSVGFRTDDLSAVRTIEVRQVARIVIAADSASRDGRRVPVDVAPGSGRVRMVPGDVHFYSVKQVIDTNDNDIFPELDPRKGRFVWTSSGPGLMVTVADGVLSREGRSVATARGLYEVSVFAGGRRGALVAEVGGLASARVVNASPAATRRGTR